MDLSEVQETRWRLANDRMWQVRRVVPQFVSGPQNCAQRRVVLSKVRGEEECEEKEGATQKVTLFFTRSCPHSATNYHHHQIALTLSTTKK